MARTAHKTTTVKPPLIGDDHPLEQWRVNQEKRLGKRYPRYRLAEELCCVPSWITQIIEEGKPPSGELALRIKRLTGISTDEIFNAAAFPERCEKC